ncbi:MAG: filamentous hemagglutinin N-terminal domain-containing protein [Saccharospirillum sp.]|uniref:beta strand repeat-containing protein n=1 Tax=Saccharospirillum sp. TaxID=2033801 RepID=UPI00329816BC
MDKFAVNKTWAALGLCSPLLAIAAPVGGTVESGSATISQSGQHTQIDQSSQSAIVGWEQFDVGISETVTFAVPNASSITLNQIYDQNPSQILGQVSSNGRLILANPNGLYFGSGSNLNVGALIATTSDVELVDDTLLMHGASTSAGINHQGAVNASGSVAYYSPRLDLSGSIIAAGDIHLSNHTSGTITLSETGIGFEVSDSGERALDQQGINVTGSVRSDGGYIGIETAAVNGLYDAALNVEGMISADSLVTDGGKVELTASAGTALVTGDVSASSATGTGGDIRVAGDLVQLTEDSTVSANGASGGGVVYIGGGWDYTSGPDIARRTVLNANTDVSADATENGDGGDVWIWSEEQTVVQGELSVRGVGPDGDGGFVETSSLGQLVVENAPDLGSDTGSHGEWLLDPQRVYITPNALPTNVECVVIACNADVDSASDNVVFTPANDAADITTTIWVGFIQGVLEDGGDVTIQTTTTDTGNFIAWYDSPLVLGALGAGGSATLTLKTSGGIYINSEITSATDPLTLNLEAGQIVYPFGDAAFTVDTLRLDTPLMYHPSDISINASSVITQNDMNWDIASGADLTFSGQAVISSDQEGGLLDFNVFSADSVIRFGDIGLENLGLGTLDLRNVSGSIVFGGSQITLDSLLLPSGARIFSDDALTVSADSISVNGVSRWNASDDLNINNTNNNSVFNNNGQFTFNMSGNSLNLDSVNTSTISSLSIVDAFSVGIYGEQLKQGSVMFDANNLTSYNGLTLDVDDIRLATGLVWSAESDLTFSTVSRLDSLTAAGSMSFDLNDNDLTLGGVGLGSTGVGAFNLTNVNLLSLNDSIQLSGNSALNLGSANISSIDLRGDAALTTGGGTITLAPVTSSDNDPVSGSAPVLTVSSGSGNISVGDLLNIGNVAMSSTGVITVSGNVTSLGDSIVIDAGQFRVNSDGTSVSLSTGGVIDLNAPIDSVAGTTSGLTLQAGNRVDIGSVGASNALGDFQLITGGTASLNGAVLAADTVNIDAENLSLTTDTVISVLGDSGTFNDTDITSLVSQTLSFEAAGADLVLGGDINAGALSVEASSLTVGGTLASTLGDIDLRQVNAMALSGDTTLNSGVTGSLYLADDISGPYALTLSIGEGNLELGSQNSSDALSSLALEDSALQFGTNTSSDGIVVTGLLDLSNTGSLTVAENALFQSQSGDVLLNGTTIEAGDKTITVSAYDQAQLSDVNAGGFTLAITGSADLPNAKASLDGDITALSRLDLSQAGSIELLDDIQLTGPLLLSTGTGTTSVNGNYALTIDANNQNLTLFDMGNRVELDSLSVVNASTVQLAGGITTQGLDGISLSGNRLDLAIDTDLNTSSSSGTIDLSGIGVNGEFTLTLNAGSGNISLGDVGQNLALASLVVQEASTLALSGNIRTADTLLDLSKVQSVVLSDDVSIDTTASDGGITLGDTAIDGTFSLSLATGAGAVQLAAVGQSVALQSFSLNTEADISLDHDISVIDRLALSGNVLELNSDLNSFGGGVSLAATSDLNMSASGTVTALDDAGLSSESGSIRLGKVTSETGAIELNAGSGSIYNTLGDFVSVEDTSVNLTANRVSLIAGQDIGSGSADPIVLDVPQSGSINLSFTAPLAYIVNINQAAITSSGKVFDVLSDSQRAALSASNSAELAGETQFWGSVLSAPEPYSELFAITQPGYALASNARVEGSLSAEQPAVPAIRLQGDEWWLLHSRGVSQ